MENQMLLVVSMHLYSPTEIEVLYDGIVKTMSNVKDVIVNDNEDIKDYDIMTMRSRNLYVLNVPYIINKDAEDTIDKYVTYYNIPKDNGKPSTDNEIFDTFIDNNSFFVLNKISEIEDKCFD